MFSQILKSLRDVKSIPQAELAKSLNVAQQTVGKWERDIAYPNIETLKKLALFFNVTIDYLLEMPPTQNSLCHNDTLSTAERKHLAQYRALDNDGREVVDGLTNTLYEQRLSKSNVQSCETSSA